MKARLDAKVSLAVVLVTLLPLCACAETEDPCAPKLLYAQRTHRAQNGTWLGDVEALRRLAGAACTGYTLEVVKADANGFELEVSGRGTPWRVTQSGVERSRRVAAGSAGEDGGVWGGLSALRQTLDASMARKRAALESSCRAGDAVACQRAACLTADERPEDATAQDARQCARALKLPLTDRWAQVRVPTRLPQANHETSRLFCLEPLEGGARRPDGTPLQRQPYFDIVCEPGRFRSSVGPNRASFATLDALGDALCPRSERGSSGRPADGDVTSTPPWLGFGRERPAGC